MNSVSHAISQVRVLLVESKPGSDSALAQWLGEIVGLKVTHSDRSTTQTLVLASVLCPEVVLLDFHNRPFSTETTVALFKELSPSPTVFVLTHDASPAMRRGCLACHVDAVFDKTAELEGLRRALVELVERANRTTSTTA